MKILSEYLKRENTYYRMLNNILPDPDKLMQDNGGTYDVYRDLLIDSHLSAVIMQRKMQVLQMGWQVTCENQERRTEAIKIMENLNINKIGNEILDAIFYGFIVSEIMWEKQNNKYIPMDLIAKPQEWFGFDKDNKVQIIPNFENEIKNVTKIPKYKFIITQHKATFDNPYGEKILKKCYWPIKIKQTTMNSWNEIIEKFGIPYLIGVVSDTATQVEKDNFLDELKQMIIDNVFVRKVSEEIEVKTDNKYESGKLFNEMNSYQDKEISKAVLTVTLTVDVGNVGSYSVANVHKEMLGYIAIADKKLIEAALNKMFDYYTELNYGKNQPSIKVKLTKKESITEEYAKRDKILTEMGIVFDKEYFKKTYNLRDEDFELGGNNKNVATQPTKA